MIATRRRAAGAGVTLDGMAITRRRFVTSATMALAGLAAPPAVAGQPAAPARTGRPRAHEFVFARLRYDSGDWDYNPKVAANVLNSVVEYTNIPVYPEEVIITADSEELGGFPFLFMTGHKLVRFSERERDRLRAYVEGGGLLFSDDCNHDIAGLYATSFEAEMRRIFPEPGTLDKLPTAHPLYRAVFLPDGPPQTAHELNGWGDDLVHDYLRGVEHDGRLGVLYSNKDYGCEWDYDWRNKRFQRDDNTRFAINIVAYALTA